MVKNGSIFVTMKPQKYVLEKNHDYIINVYPGEDASFTLYEDDGFTHDYRSGLYATTLIEMTDTSDSGFNLTVHKRCGNFDGRPDNGHNIYQNSIPEIKGIQPVDDMEIFISGKKPSAIILNGVNISFEYDGTKSKFRLPKEAHEAGNVTYEIHMSWA